MSIRTDRHYLELADLDGHRHLINISSIQLLSDFDACRDETLLTAAGRTIHVRLELDVIRELIESTYDSDRTSCRVQRARRNRASKENTTPSDWNRQSDDIRDTGRIASPELLPDFGSLPHLICSRALANCGGDDEAGEHDNTQ